MFRKILKKIFKSKLENKSIVGLKSTESTRLAEMPRFTQTSTEFFGSYFIIPDSCSFLSSYKEIFLDEVYKFSILKKSPVIIDCGANIGMATMYFKCIRFTNPLFE